MNTWIAVELLTEAPSGETAEQVHSRFRREAENAGLESAEIDHLRLDPDMSCVVEKHGHPAHGS